MFGKFRREETSIYDEPITQILERMATADPEEHQYAQMVKHLDKLTKMKGKNSRNRINKDTLLIVGGNLVGILMIVAYEQKHVLRSTATSFLHRVK